MLLTNNQILAISEAILHLDGRYFMQVVEGKAVAIFKSFLLDHAARWALACAQGKLQAAIADFNRAKDALINHHSVGAGSIEASSPNFKPFSAELEKLGQQSVELDLQTITLAQLRLPENQTAGSEIPIAVLNALAPLIRNVAAQEQANPYRHA